jgi:hypothetical protein
MASWYLDVVGFLALDCGLATYGSKYSPRPLWHLVPGSGFYAAWRRLCAPAPLVKSFWDDILDIEPGHITVLSDKRNGNQYALMNLDDFDHLIGTGNRFVRRQVSASPSQERT